MAQQMRVFWHLDPAWLCARGKPGRFRERGAGSGTSLPSRDYYTEEKFATERTQFSEHLTKVGTMFGFAEDFAARVLAFETKLAQIQMKPDQSRLFDQTYTITTLDDFIAEVCEPN